MNRVEIKEKAKSMLSGNYWNIWWPLLVIGVIESCLNYIFKVTPSVDFSNIKELFNYHMSTGGYVGFGLIAIITGVINAGYLKYVVNFVRTGKFDANDIINTMKEKWLDLLIAVILTTVIIAIGFACLVIPGIILSFAYTLVTFLVVDKNVKGIDALKESRTLMRGHKFEVFILGLSFIGWGILVPFTFGILAIWLVPYITVTFAIYYDYLTKDYKNN